MFFWCVDDLGCVFFEDVERYMDVFNLLMIFLGWFGIWWMFIDLYNCFCWGIEKVYVYEGKIKDKECCYYFKFYNL